MAARDTVGVRFIGFCSGKSGLEGVREREAVIFAFLFLALLIRYAVNQGSLCYRIGFCFRFCCTFDVLLSIRLAFNRCVIGCFLNLFHRIRFFRCTCRFFLLRIFGWNTFGFNSVSCCSIAGSGRRYIITGNWRRVVFYTIGYIRHHSTCIPSLFSCWCLLMGISDLFRRCDSFVVISFHSCSKMRFDRSSLFCLVLVPPQLLKLFLFLFRVLATPVESSVRRGIAERGDSLGVVGRRIVLQDPGDRS
mmetsp:Transcript_26822/g.63969  ORF Transcript_26822/g.63969 Transcript_26822/m.63969 type:complete len:248 (+) Transcript_26822:845-1588(+)